MDAAKYRQLVEDCERKEKEANAARFALVAAEAEIIRERSASLAEQRKALKAKSE